MQNENTESRDLLSSLDNIHVRYIIQLEKRVDTLKFICKDLNPYEPLTEKQIAILTRFDITDVSDPFKVTNLLLMHLEDSINELQKLKS